jgi:ubiquinone/menaquinone biosynthesis C-methylase UbiE
MEALGSSSLLLDRLELAAGMKMLDAGCGPGRVSIPAAERVGPEGEVVALDIQPAMLSKLEARAAARGLSNLRLVLGGIGQGLLDHNAFDRAILATVLGEIPDRQAALREIFAALKPGGILSITEIFPDPHYQSRNTVRRLAEAVGFHFKHSYGNWWAFTMNFEKR